MGGEKENRDGENHSRKRRRDDGWGEVRAEWGKGDREWGA